MEGECCKREEDQERRLFCICLEDYMDFSDDLLHRPDFIIDQLNHIIFMHGFIRMHGRHKAEIMRTLDAMELMQAGRSTLQESISCCAPLAVEEVIRDLQAIGWRECPVGSVQSVGPPPSGAIEDDTVTIASPLSTICCPTTSASAAREKEEEKKKAAKRLTRKRKRAQAALSPPPPPSHGGPHQRSGLPLKSVAWGRGPTHGV